MDEVNEAWAGLGYYRRARFLLEGAQTIAAGPGAAMPRNAKDWLKIPGKFRCSDCHVLWLMCSDPGCQPWTVKAGSKSRAANVLPVLHTIRAMPLAVAKVWPKPLHSSGQHLIVATQACQGRRKIHAPRIMGTLKPLLYGSSFLCVRPAASACKDTMCTKSVMISNSSFDWTDCHAAR